MNSPPTPPDQPTPTADDAERELVVRTYAESQNAGIVLEQARHLIVAGWTRNALARTRHGRPVAPAHPAAARYCVVGAVLRGACDCGIEEPLAGLPPGGVVTEMPRGAARLALCLYTIAARARLARLPQLVGADPDVDPAAPDARSVAWAATSWMERASRAERASLVDPMIVGYPLLLNDAKSTRRRDVLAEVDLAIAAAEIATAGLPELFPEHTAVRPTESGGVS